jgi:DNA-binding NtrC family response regulator
MVLIVDDEPDLCELLSITLGRMGLESRAVHDVASAKAKTNPATTAPTSAKRAVVIEPSLPDITDPIPEVGGRQKQLLAVGSRKLATRNVSR